MSAGGKAGKIGKVVLGVSFLIALLLVPALLFRTNAIELVGKTALNFYGFKDVSLTVNAVDTDNIHIDQISFSKQIILRDIRVEYRPFSLFSGQVDEIDIGELLLDISEPAEGAFARISEIAGEEDAESPADTARHYPKIVLQKGTIVAEGAEFSLSASLSGTFSSDQELTAQGSLLGRIDTAAGAVLFDDMRFLAEADVAVQKAKFELTDGVFRHDVETPDWAPLSLAGSGRLIDGIAEIQVALRTSKGDPLAQLAGRYKTDTGNGDVQASLSSLSFRRDGFQPSDLSRYAANLPLFDGTLDFTGNAKIAGSVVAYEADVEMTSLYMELDDGSVASERFLLGIKGQYLPDDGTQDTKITLPKSDAVLTYSGQKYNVKDVAVSLRIVNLAEIVELVSFGGTVTHNAANAYFSPLSFNGSGEMNNHREISVSGAVRDEPGKFDLDISAQYLVEDGLGNVSLRLPPTTIGAGGIALSELSPFLKQADGLSGVVTGQVEIVRENDGDLVISSVQAELSEGHWNDIDAEVNDLAFTMTARQTDADASLQGDVTGQAAGARFKEQSVVIPRLEASFEAEHQNLQSVESGLLTLSNLTIVPDEGAFFKETQIVTGVGRIKKNDVDFSLEVMTDFLGSYLNIVGQYSLSAAAGSAQINMKPLSFTKDGLQPKDFVVLEADLTLDGRIVPDAVISWSADGLNSSVDVTLEDLSINASGGNVSNMNGKIHINELFPLTISESQEITAVAAVAGIPLEEPVLRFRVLTEAGDPQLYIDRMALGLVGGTAVIDDAVIDTGAETNRIEVQLTRLDLEEVMALSNVEELVATGEVSGRVPLVFGGDRLIVDEALLSADGPGVLKMTSDAARRALEGGGEQAKLLLDILENFQYSELSIEIMKTQSGEDTVKLHAEGANPDVENNRPIVLNINLTTSLDKIFNTLLEGYLLSEKALRATVKGR